MPVAVLRPFGPRGTVETPIARSHSCPLAPAAAGRRTAFSYHISGYLGQRDEPLPVYIAVLLILKALQGLVAAVKPITAAIPASVEFDEILAMLVLAVIFLLPV